MSGPTARQIKDKLESLSEDERLSADAIQGISEGGETGSDPRVIAYVGSAAGNDDTGELFNYNLPFATFDGVVAKIVADPSPTRRFEFRGCQLSASPSFV